MTCKCLAYWSLAILFSAPASAMESGAIPAVRPDCKANNLLKVADFSLRLTGLRTDAGEPVLHQLKTSFQLDTVFRYYDHKDETLPGKTLSATEADEIIAAGLKIGVVFQHHNDDPAKFLDPASGTQDADRALELADKIRQPYGSAIYFGVDGPERHLGPLIQEYKLNSGNPMSDERKATLKAEGRFHLIASYRDFIRFGGAAFELDKLDEVTPAKMEPVIQRYFNAIHRAFQLYSQRHHGKGYKVGMYCTGAMCLLGDRRKLADYFWISPEGRNDPEYRQFLNQNRWNLVQQLPTSCSNWTSTSHQRDVGFDFDYLNPDYPDFGQWAAKR